MSAGLVEPALAGRALEVALARGGDFAELYAEDRRTLALSLDERRVERPLSGHERGVSVRLVAGDSTYFGHVDGLGEGALLALAESVSRALGDGAAAGSAPALRLVAPVGAAAHPVAQPPEGVEVVRKTTLLRECDEVARAAGAAIAQVKASYSDARRRVEVYNSDGAAAGDDRTRVHLGVQAIARAAGVVETARETRGGHAGFELLADAAREVAGSAAAKAIVLLEAVDAPTGRMPVVVGNGFGGVLLHEAVGHGLEADHVQKRASVYAGRLGERLAQPLVTAYDDGRLPGAWGSDGIDDEGTPTKRTTILADGELVSFLYDLGRARRDGVESTGNGRRESFRHIPLPRMTNTYFAPGEATPAELIAGVERGLYAVSFGGGQVEPASGDFVFGVSEGYLIEDGKVTAPVRQATLIGNCLDALSGIDAIADDLEIGTGFCGKGGQSVAAGVGQPHVRMGALTVGGTAA